MYSFYVDFHEGALRLTVKKRRGAIYRFLTGQAETTIIEAYLGRSDCINLGGTLINKAAALGMVKQYPEHHHAAEG